MILHKTVSIIKQFIKKCGNDNIGAYSAQSAFFVIISAFPLAIITMSLIKLVYISADDVVSIISEILPAWLDSFITEYINEITRLSDRAIISISSVVALFSASRGIFAIIKGLNSVAGTKETRSYIMLQVTACIYTIILIAVIIITLVFMVYGNTIYTGLCKIIPDMTRITHLAYLFRIIFLITILTLFFILLYTSVPNRKISPSSQIPGAVLCSFGWIGFSFLYSVYVDNVSNYSVLYGSVSTIVLFMLWIYFCMYIMFVGAEINNMLYTHKLQLKSGKTQSIGDNKK